MTWVGVTFIHIHLTGGASKSWGTCTVEHIDAVPTGSAIGTGARVALIIVDVTGGTLETGPTFTLVCIDLINALPSIFAGKTDTFIGVDLTC